MNGPVFVAASISRGNDWDSSISLVGHQNIVSVASFNPLLLCRDRSKPPLDSSNIVSVMAMAARSSISVWNSLVPHPIVVLHDVVERDIMDLNWSRDGQTLWVCSSDGHVAALQFDMPELLQGAFPCGSRELDMVLKEFWGDFKRARRPLAPTQPNGSQPNSQQPVQAPQPQKTTILPNGKRRIAPSLLSGLAQPSATQSQSSASGSAAVFPISGPSQAQLPPRAPTQPASAGAPLTSTPTLQRNGFPPPPPAPAPLQQQAQAAFASANAAPAMPMPMQMQMPPPQQQAVYHSHPQYAPQPMLSEPIFASSAMARDALPPNLETDLSLKPTKHHRHVKGSTLGGTREREKREPLIDEIRPAFIPDDEEGSSREMRLAVPAVKSFFKASARDWTEAEVVEAADTEHIEVRNFKPASKEEAEHKPSEVCLVALPAPGEKGATERTMWLDYLEHYVVAGTWNGVFGAVSSIDGMLTVYTNAGRR